MKNNNLIITADDFGISPGVNQAIIKACNEGALTNASIMANMDYFDDAVKRKKEKANKLNIGLHVNLTTGKALSNKCEIPSLVDENGYFKHTFTSLLLLPFKKNKKTIQNEIKKEIESQITKCFEQGIRITHIDGHRHIHIIPWVFEVVLKVSKRHCIPRIRIINENLINTLITYKNISILFSSAIIKYFVLKFFSLINNYRSSTYFYSILHSCQISYNKIKNIKIPKKYDKIEIMLHPGITKIDQKSEFEIKEKKHLLSKYRDIELESAILLKNILD